MASVDYSEIYKLQDKILKNVYENENEFYLTGGTCLHRFYINERYSDDLDFFTNQSKRFNIAVKKVKIELQKPFNVKAIIESKDFNRYLIENILQIDFVNDVSARCGDVRINKDGYILDSIENIAGNKISTIIGRDEAKDVFDVFAIDKHFNLDWAKIIECAREKTSFGIEDLLARLKTFPLELLEKITVVNEDILEDFKNNYKKLIIKIEKQAESLE